MLARRLRRRKQSMKIQYKFIGITLKMIYIVAAIDVLLQLPRVIIGIHYGFLINNTIYLQNILIVLSYFVLALSIAHCAFSLIEIQSNRSLWFTSSFLITVIIDFVLYVSRDYVFDLSEGFLFILVIVYTLIIYQIDKAIVERY